MIKTFVTAAAASTFLMVAASAHAQDTTTSPTPPSGTSSDTNTDAGTATGGASGTSTTTTTNSAAQAVAGTYLTEQSNDQISAEDYIGTTVYNANNESIGEINDLIIEKNGGVAAAVIGVGGFLGMGEKNVAVPMSNIMVAPGEDGTELKLTTNETMDTLKSAPEFRTLAMKRSETKAADPEPGAAGTAPAENSTTPGTSN